MNELAESVVTACRILTHRRLVEAFGHFSARIPGTSQFLISPRRSLSLVASDADLVRMDLNGEKISGVSDPPLETLIHSAMYRARPDVGAIARTHSFATSVFGILGHPIGVVHDFGAILLGDIPVFPDSALIETEALGEKLAAFIGPRAGALLAGNGTAIVGDNPMMACLRAIYLEESAALQLEALKTGEPRYFTEAEIEARGRQLLAPAHLERAWEHYKREAIGGSH